MPTRSKERRRFSASDVVAGLCSASLFKNVGFGFAAGGAPFSTKIDLRTIFLETAQVFGQGRLSGDFRELSRFK